MIRITFVSLLSVVIVGTAVRADEYQGAAAVIAAAEAAAKTGPAGKTNEQNSGQKYLDDLKAYKTAQSHMTAAEAAATWVALFDQLMALSPAQRLQMHDAQYQSLGFSNLVAVLPPPEKWDALITAIESRPAGTGAAAVHQASLHLFSDLLKNNPSAQLTDLQTITEAIRHSPTNSESQAGFDVRSNFLPQLAHAINEGGDQTDEIIKAFKDQMAEAKAGSQTGILVVPDLVTLVGATTAETLLREALELPINSLRIEVGDETVKLARRLAVEMVGKMPVPRWDLVSDTSGESVKLFEALRDRFVKKPSETQPALGSSATRWFFTFSGSEAAQNTPFIVARTYYILALIISNRTDEAIKQVKEAAASQGWELTTSTAEYLLESPASSESLYQFTFKLLSDQPDLPLWETYIAVASKTGHTEEMLAFARKSATREPLGDAQRIVILNHFANALLAADHVDEGVEALLKAHDLANKKKNETVSAKFQLGVKLAKIGSLLHRPEWLDEGLKLIRESRDAATENDWYFWNSENSIPALAAEIGHGPEWEAFLATQLARLKKPNNNGWSGDMARNLLSDLVMIYHETGRQLDVMILFDQSPDWGASDVAQLFNTDLDRPIAFCAAAGLAKTGRNAEAVRVLEAVLNTTGGYDPAYQLLIDLQGKDAIPLLDALFHRDQFEERPLIWKGVALLNAGDSVGAEKLFKQAIAVDPSDGDEGRGDRMRAYAMLSEVYKRRGDQKQSQFLDQIVTTIRIGEDADRLYDAGLLKRGIKMYEEALTHFADAYCVQSRLALRLAQLGDTQAANEHYRRAYELMPDSFGRLESHCFSCEGVFRGANAQSIAERVFQRLINEQPRKPQVHYLMGYLRMQQDRYAESLPYFSKAVELDPDYLKAWSELESIGGHIRLSRTQRDAAALAMLRLDPLQRHTTPDLTGFGDLRKLWGAIEEARALQPPTFDKLYELAASRRVQEQRAAAAEKLGNEGRSLLQQNSYVERRALQDPAEIVATHQVVQALNGILAQ